MKQVGIWIDKREAKIISIGNGSEDVANILSELEEFHPKGGSGTRFKGGPQDVVQDSKYLNREKQQLTQFFEKVVNHIEDAEAVVIFGPAETGEKLHTELSQKHSELFARTNPVEKADVMTDNQLISWVKDYFK